MLYVYLGAAIFYLLSVGGAGWYGLDQGKKIERSGWLEQDVKQREQVAKELGEAMRRVAEQKEQSDNNLMRSLNEREFEINRLNNDLAASKRLHIRTQSTACNANAVPGTPKNSSLPDGTIETELPAEIESGLRELARDAEQELINCNALKNIISKHVEIIN